MVGWNEGRVEDRSLKLLEKRERESAKLET